MGEVGDFVPGQRPRENPHKLLATARSPYFWTVMVMLALSGILHYLTPQERGLPLSSLHFTRHAIERIIFLVPIGGAAFAFGRTGGLVVLGVSGLIMLPRVFLLSPYASDAGIEMLGILVVGGAFVWLIDAQEQEKRRHRKTVDKLATLNAISITLSQTVDLDEILHRALDKVLELASNLDPKGVLFLLDPMSHTLRPRVQRGFPADLLARDIQVPLEEYLHGAAAKAGEVLVVFDARQGPRHAHCLESSPHAHVCIPLKSKERLLGILDLYLGDAHAVDIIDRQLFASIGRQIGVAIENASLCDNLRFYIQQITRAQEGERKRIARELHDETTQELVDISRRLDDLTSEENFSEPARVRLEGLQRRLENLSEGVRRFSRDLRPSALDDLGLLPALKGLLRDTKQHDIEPVLHTRGTPRRLAADVELALFRIVQEALNNVIKHSGASQVTVEIEFFEQKVRVIIQDNGHGFELEGRLNDWVTLGKFGLVGMQERAQLLGGGFSVFTDPATGTILITELPA